MSPVIFDILHIVKFFVIAECFGSIRVFFYIIHLFVSTYQMYITVSYAFIPYLPEQPEIALQNPAASPTISITQ